MTTIFRRRVPVHLVGLALTILALAAGMTVVYPGFASAANAEVIAMNFILEAFMALGMTAVIITGGIDLSVSAVLPFSAIVAALLLGAGVPVPVAVLAALAAAAAIGVLNGSLTNVLRVHPFIVTLGMMLALKGLNLVLTRGAPLSGFPAQFASIGQGRIAWAPVPLLLFGAVAVALGVALRHHRFWQQVYLVGGNIRAARTSGVRVERVLLVVYGLSGLLAGVAGVVAASQYGSVNAGFGQNAELKVITAVVIGGASLNGGRGSVGGSVLGVLFLAVLYNAFAMTGASTYWQDVVSGGMVLAAVLLGEALARRPAGMTRSVR